MLGRNRAESESDRVAIDIKKKNFTTKITKITKKKVEKGKREWGNKSCYFLISLFCFVTFVIFVVENIFQETLWLMYLY